MTYAEEVRVVILKLSGFKDPALADLLPGAARVAEEASDLLRRLLLVVEGHATTTVGSI